MASTVRSEMMNGTLPIMIARESTCGNTAWHAKSVMPNGGVIMPISYTWINKMPNHMGSQPMDKAIGKIVGMVRNNIAAPSMKVPSIR